MLDKAFGGDPTFPFIILQSAGIGAKSLIVPSLSDNYEWKAKEVANSGGTRAIYIWAQKELCSNIAIVSRKLWMFIIIIFNILF